jgi:hypothetical protein
LTRLNLARERRVFRYRVEKRRATVRLLEPVMAARRGEAVVSALPAWERAAMLRSFERALRAEVVI